MKEYKIMFKRQALIFLLVVVPFLVFGETPKRIISLVPSLTKNLYLLGAEDLLVGCTSFCTLQNPDDAKVVASAVQVNIEKALLLKPDLVLASSLTKPETLAMFEKLGIETISFPYPKSFDNLCSYFLTLGEKVGKKELAEKIVHNSRNQVEALKQAVPKKENAPKIFMQIGANPLFSVVPKTFMQDFIDFAGCENIASDLAIGSITRESVLVRNPEVIFIILMGSVSSEEKDKWEKYKSLQAVKNNKIFVLDSEPTCSPTPPQFARALEEIIQSVYKK